MRPLLPLLFAAAALALAACMTDLSPEDEARIAGQASLTARPRQLLRNPERIPGQYIVVLKAGAPDVAEVARRQAAATGARVGRVFTHALHGYVLHGSEAAA